ncbi:uncharacterized protein Z520_05200 [Fonsecaea multimorphosa CBS 102226]|uniref:Cytochrome P450 n=1 Tax=Fonsecaea multimorphosa CBS 102226 TaxID=1442371 RepID=A0A0D2K6C2_9EURO|nr:uncharacterized protein Z520_05200 [Fonsecaea multimorphosa CBS 102226]KIX98739.1 hypothetical protein Z520_05200 [Fonsecaea multimorphosa CBS 102226]OAL25023.1 hypothetical protein AYO22_04900 [Fonsecaea multimorphosa]
MDFLKTDAIQERLQVQDTFVLSIACCLLLGFFALLREAYRTDIPKVKGIPEVPGAKPFIGHLGPLGGREKRNDTVIFSRWAEQLKTDIYQIRLGSQRAIIVHGWEPIKDLWLGQSTSLSDRPWQPGKALSNKSALMTLVDIAPGFIDKLGVDISSSPLTPQIKRCRISAMKALGKPLWPDYYSLLEPSSVAMMRRVYERGENGQKTIDLYLYFQQVVYDLILHLTYGARMGDIDDSFATELLESVQALTEIRSSTADFSHYVPLLRAIPRGETKVVKTEKRRRVQLDFLYQQYLDKVAKGEEIHCIVSQLGKDKLSLEEIRGTCVSLLQAAPETVASGMYMACAWLSTPEGQKFQPKLLDAILKVYGGDKEAAWNNAFREEAVPLVTSMYKETLRCYAPTPFAQGRAVSKDIPYRDFVIPKGITIIMNGQQANLDPAAFGPDAGVFKPERFLGDNSALPHLAFGAGARQCPAMNISNRMMYGLLIRTVLAFRIQDAGPGGRKPPLDMRDFSDYYGLVNVPRSYDCLMIARDPEWLLNLPEENVLESASKK